MQTPIVRAAAHICRRWRVAPRVVRNPGQLELVALRAELRQRVLHESPLLRFVDGVRLMRRAARRPAELADPDLPALRVEIVEQLARLLHLSDDRVGVLLVEVQRDRVEDLARTVLHHRAQIVAARACWAHPQ